MIGIITHKKLDLHLIFHSNVPSSLIQCKLYGLGWGTIDRLSFLTSLGLQQFQHDTLSMIKNKFWETLQRVWNMFSPHDSSCGLGWLLTVLQIIKRSLSYTYASLLIWVSHYSLALSLVHSTSLLYTSWAFMRMVLIKGHWDFTCPRSRHLKYLISLVRVDATC